MTATPDWDLTGATPIHVMAYDEEALEEVTLSSLPAARERVGRRRVTWINVDRVDDPAMLLSLERDFGVHPLTVEDVRNLRQRPKVEEYENYLYVVIQMIRRVEGELVTEQVSILVGDGWVVTVQDKPGDVWDDVRARLRQGRPRIRASGADYLLYRLVDAIVDAYFPILEEMGERSEALEERVEEGDAASRNKLQDMRRELLTLRRVAWPQRDALNQLERGETRWVTHQTKTYLRDVSDHATRVLEFVETERELLASLMDLHLATVTQRTNDVMKVLTLVATIFIPLTFVAGVYGMNFEFMPELEWRYGYPAVMLFMLVVALGMLFGFRRRGWI